MDRITSKTGGAKIRKLGQTAASRGGRDSRATMKGGATVRDESAK
jgi:hypothetical protein